MIRKPLCLAVLLALLVAGLADAQTKSGPKLYRWVDKQGKVHFDDALPPEAVDQARQEFNARTGSVTGSVDRALTPEERAQLAAAAQAAIVAAAAANEQKRQEDIMMASYETEGEMRRAYGERVALLKMTLDSTDISINSLRENLATILADASDTELANRRVAEERVNTIRELHAEKVKQQVFQVNRRGELAALNSEFARMLTRYRELRDASTPPTTPPAAAPGTP